MNITFPQSYYISHILTIGHDCPAWQCQFFLLHPFDPLGGIKDLFDPLGGVKGQILKLVSCQYFVLKFYMQAEEKFKLFQKMVMLQIKLKGTTHAATW